MKENNLSIHTDTGDLYYNGINTGESVDDFVLYTMTEVLKNT